MSHSDEYRAIHHGAVLGALSRRSQLAVAGADRATYLQGLLTNDIVALTPGTGCYAAWLTPQGRMLTDLDVLESGDLILLDLPFETTGATLERLEQFVFSEDVQIASLATDLTGIALHGPLASSMLEGVIQGVANLSAWPSYCLEKGSFGDVPVVVVRNDQLLVPGYCAYVPTPARAAFSDALRNRGAVEPAAWTAPDSDEGNGRPEALEAARIEAGYPLFGVDMTEDTIPLEAGIEGRAISLTKGCYVGQEVIIRVLHRGHGRVAKRLVAFRSSGETFSAGARVVAAGKDVGFVTSAAVSPVNGPIALGYVHRDYVEPGTAVVATDGGRAVEATVAARPIA
jgi:folate-binding protein YgfZ